MTDQEVIEFLARELTDREGFVKEKWNPLTQTPDGYFQCFEHSGVVDMMREKGWYLKTEHYSTGLIEAGFVYKKMLPGRPQWVSETATELNRAVCLAAVKALGGKI